MPHFISLPTSIPLLTRKQDGLGMWFQYIDAAFGSLLDDMVTSPKERKKPPRGKHPLKA
jgi:hypothetical protein